MQRSALHTMTFRVQVRLNSLIHPDAIALLHNLPKENLADVMATILQLGAKVQRSINSGNSVFNVAPIGAVSATEQSTSVKGRTQTTAPSDPSTTPVVPQPNPLAAAGFDMGRAAEAFAIPPPRAH